MNKKVNCLIIAYDGLGNSGVPNVIFQTIKALHDIVCFDIVVFNNDEYYFSKLKDDLNISCNIIKLDSKPKDAKFFKIWWETFGKFNYYSNMSKIIFSSKQYDIVHSFKEFDSFPFFKIAKKYNVKKRIIHTNVIHFKTKSLIQNIINAYKKAKTLKYSSLFAAVTDIAAKHFYKNRSCLIISNTYDETIYNFSNDNSQKYLSITHIGNICENKNQLFSIEVFNILKQKYTNIRLNLVYNSSQNIYFENVIQLINNLNLKLNKDVFLINQATNLKTIYDSTSVIIHPSFHEGFSIVLVEAQACGVRCFASDSISREINCGGITYLNLNKKANYWAHEIDGYLPKSRHLYFNTSKFSNKNFSKKIYELYFNEIS